MPLQRDAAQQRRRIVRSALNVLAREGIDALSMRTVARHAGCTIGLINHWFLSKEDLITAAWQEVAETVSRNVRRAYKEGISLTLLQESLATSAAKRRDQAVWLAFNAMTIGNPKLAAAHARYYANGRGQLKEMLTQVGYSGARPPKPPESSSLQSTEFCTTPELSLGTGPRPGSDAPLSHSEDLFLRRSPSSASPLADVRFRGPILESRLSARGREP